jgi:hypothetical protein
MKSETKSVVMLEGAAPPVDCAKEFVQKYFDLCAKDLAKICFRFPQQLSKQYFDTFVTCSEERKIIEHFLSSPLAAVT